VNEKEAVQQHLAALREETERLKQDVTEGE
jgi:hypothetical protein